MFIGKSFPKIVRLFSTMDKSFVNKHQFCIFQQVAGGTLRHRTPGPLTTAATPTTSPTRRKRGGGEVTDCTLMMLKTKLINPE